MCLAEYLRSQTCTREYYLCVLLIFFNLTHAFISISLIVSDALQVALSIVLYIHFPSYLSDLLYMLI